MLAVPEDVIPELHRLTRAQYEGMIDAGLIDEDARVELLYGVIVDMTPPSPPHSSAIDILNDRFTTALAGRARVRIQNPFAASDYSEPEPDVAVVPLGDYRKEHPRSAHLIVEVAYSSLKKDRLKAALYAECGVPEYWIVDVERACVDVHRDPRAGTYATVTTARPGDRLTVAAFPDVTLDVASLF